METPTPASSTPKPHLRPLLFVFAALIAAGVFAFSQSSSSSVEAALKTPANVAPSAESKAAAANHQAFILKTYKGESADAAQRALVERVGAGIAGKSEAKDSGKTLKFILLAEPDAINSFALPTGEVYVTTALVNRMQTEGELAAALSQGVAHVLIGHRMQPDAPAEGSVLQFSTENESDADAKTLKIMADAGYSPEALLSMFKILTEAYNAGANVQFFATHPSADWRLANIEKGIKSLYPEGVPAVLSK